MTSLKRKQAVLKGGANAMIIKPATLESLEDKLEDDRRSEIVRRLDRIKNAQAIIRCALFHSERCAKLHPRADREFSIDEYEWNLRIGVTNPEKFGKL